MEIINNTQIRPVNVPPGPLRPYVSPVPQAVAAIANISLSTSPDFSYDSLFEHIANVENSLAVYIYQVAC